MAQRNAFFNSSSITAGEAAQDAYKTLLAEAKAQAHRSTHSNYYHFIENKDYAGALRMVCFTGLVSPVLNLLRYKEQLGFDVNALSCTGFTALDFIQHTPDINSLAKNSITNALLSHNAKTRNEIMQEDGAVAKNPGLFSISDEGIWSHEYQRIPYNNGTQCQLSTSKNVNAPYKTLCIGYHKYISRVGYYVSVILDKGNDFTPAALNLLREDLKKFPAEDTKNYYVEDNDVSSIRIFFSDINFAKEALKIFNRNVLENFSEKDLLAGFEMVANYLKFYESRLAITPPTALTMTRR